MGLPQFADPTGSSLDRAEKCPASFAVAGLDHTGEEAAAGHALHAFIETARVDREAALAAAPEADREAFAALPIEQIPEGLESELPVGFRVEDRTGKVYSREEVPSHRAYPPDGLVHATLDLAGVSEDGQRVYYYDVKRYGAATSAEASLQLGLGVVALARVTGATSAESGFVRPIGEDFAWEKARFDEDDIAATEERIVRAVLGARAAQRRALAGDRLTFTPGPWCRYCPARFLACPEVTKASDELLALAAAPPAKLTIEEWFNALSPEEAGALVAKAHLVHQIAEVVDKVARKRVRETGEPIPLGGGKVLGTKLWTVTETDPQAAEEMKALEADLVTRGLIRKVRRPMVRVVAAANGKGR